jgi:(S)-2-hydroxy-acid oxidase
MSEPVGPVNEQYMTVTNAGPSPVNVAEYERFAESSLSKNAFGYYASGSNDMITLRENRAAFTRLRLMPKVLVDVSNINMQTTILGQKVAFPICIAPTAMQRMAHDDGESATSKAAARHGILMTLSSWSTLPLEDVAAAAPQGFRWFQLYVYKDREVTLDLVKRAERAGYKAFAVTVDTPILGRREADLKNKFALPSHLTMGNFASTGGAHAQGTKQSGSSGSGLASYVSSLIDRTLNWDDIAWLRRNTTLKIVVKGVMTVDDALISIRNGVDAIWISNHGARQLDTTPATIEVLPEIARAVAGRVELYIDGGISRGTDALKAIALGARAVFIGRPVLWGLAHSGEEGVYNVVNLLKEEFALAMALSGCVKVEDIKPSLVRTALSFQSKL